MQKEFLLMLLISMFSHYTMAQEPADLSSINAAAKDPYVKPEMLDQLMIRLRPLENSVPTGQEMLLLETYKTIAARYAANNHFKQAYEVFKKYLGHKEAFYTRGKNNTLQEAHESVEKRTQSDIVELTGLQNHNVQLQSDSEQLSSKRSRFKRYFSLGILALSIFFGAVFLRFRLRLSGIRQHWKHSRDQMKSLHRISVVGVFGEGYRKQTLKNVSSIAAGTQEISVFLQEQNFLRSNLKGNVKDIEETCAGIKNVLNSK